MIVSTAHSRANSQDMNQFVSMDNEHQQRHPVVAVGTALPTASLPPGVQQAPVMLTAKNLQCMRAILHLAHCHGGILGTSWHIVLATLQHLAWILGLKPSTGGFLQVEFIAELKRRRDFKSLLFSGGSKTTNRY
jgi:hypothetical protein